MCSGAWGKEACSFQDRVPRACRLFPFRGHTAVIWGRRHRAESPDDATSLREMQHLLPWATVSLYALPREGRGLSHLSPSTWAPVSHHKPPRF